MHKMAGKASETSSEKLKIRSFEMTRVHLLDETIKTKRLTEDG